MASRSIKTEALGYVVSQRCGGLVFKIPTGHQSRRSMSKDRCSSSRNIFFRFSFLCISTVINMSTSSSALSRIPIIGGAVGSLTGSKHQEQQRHLQNAVRPLPSARPRRLTLPLPETEQPAEDGMKPQTTNAQPQSAFFSMLPPEMRMNIYRHCFPLEKISIEKDERLRYVNWKPQKRGVLPLLLACRRVYDAHPYILTSPVSIN